jgi:aminomethyltransferase
VLRGLTVEGRQPPRAGASVLVDGSVVGEVTSGNFSPTLGHGIALALVESGVPDEGEAELDLRGKRVAARLTKPPFVRKR